jgi:NADPH:quinone reductase-like Zn-dependent oxidoreductase
VSEDRKEDLQVLIDMVQAGTLRPIIDRRYPLTEIRAAYEHVESRHRAGAIVVDVVDRQADRLTA